MRIIRRQNEATAARVFQPVKARLAALLLELGHTHDYIEFDGPQALLARRLGVARQTPNRTLHTLADHGLLILHPGGRAVTLDRARLAAFLST